MFVYLHSRSTGAAPDSVPGRSDDTGDTEEGGADFRLGLCCAGTDGFSCWSDGRVARQRSAKPCTAVRVRFRPHRNRVADVCNAVFVLSYGKFPDVHSSLACFGSSPPFRLPCHRFVLRGSACCYCSPVVWQPSCCRSFLGNVGPCLL